MRTRPLLTTLAALPLLASALLPVRAAAAPAPVQVILDGRVLTLDPAPTIVNERTLVPLRGIFEAMGAKLEWYDATRTVEVTRGDKYLRLKIDRRLTCLNRECSSAATMDVPARLIGDRTYVPVRFISQAMGFNVTWDNDRRAVVIDTTRGPDYKFTNVMIPSLVQGQLVKGPVTLRAEGAAGNKVQYYLMNPETGAGPMIAAGSDPAAAYTYTPDPGVSGWRLVVAAITDEAGTPRYSDPIPVLMAPDPKVQVTGLDQGGVIDGPISFGNEVNFVATWVEFKLMDAQTGVSQDLGRVGPNERFTWNPQAGHSGDKLIQAIAYDRYDKQYPSAAIPVKVQVDRHTAAVGIKEGDVLSRPRTLSIAVNFPKDQIESIKYVLDDQVLGWGWDFYWKFGPERNGAHTLRIEVRDKQGSISNLGPYNFTVQASPYLLLNGVAPGQVVTDKVSLTASSNMTLSGIEYYLINSSGATEFIGRSGPWEPLTWTPKTAGSQSLQAKAVDTNGNVLWTEKVGFRAYLGTVYTQPYKLTTTDEFKALASRLSVPAYHNTGMAASLQVAQALLETGWGQSVPVDKYSGRVSYNLFGIKGTGPAGSITSNTWEVYNGKDYRVDAQFRAYNNVEESWKDHKDLLLTKPWYAPFRAVMADPVLGAWALRKSGYATDPNYPVKLIRLMKENGLFKLNDIEL